MAVFAILIPLMVLGVAVALVPLLVAMRQQARRTPAVEPGVASNVVALPLSEAQRRGALRAA